MTHSSLLLLPAWVSVLPQYHITDSIQLNPISLCPGACQARAEEGQGRFVMCNPGVGPRIQIGIRHCPWKLEVKVEEGCKPGSVGMKAPR